MSSVAQSYGLGQTAASGELEHLLGQRACFRDINYASTEAVKPLLSQMDIIAVWVKNESGSAITPGTVCRWDSGATYGPGKAVAGAAAIASDQVPCGVADPYLPTAGVANDEHFWLIVEGPCKFKFTTGTTLDNIDVLQLGAAGRVTKYDVGTPAAGGNLYRVGRSLEAVDTGVASDTLFRGYADIRF